MTHFESTEDARVLTHARVAAQQPEIPPERVQVPKNLSHRTNEQRDHTPNQVPLACLDGLTNVDHVQ